MQLMIWIRYNSIKQFFTLIIAVRPAKHEIIIAGTDEASYEYSNTPQAHYAVRACQLLHAPIVNTTVWPGKFLEVDATPPPPSDLLKDSTLAVEPRIDSVSSSHLKPTHAWPHPNIIQAVGGKLRLVNDTKEPLLIRKKDHFCQARLTVSDHSQEPSKIRTSSSPPKITAPDLFPVESVRMDPDGLLSASGKASFM